MAKLNGLGNLQGAAQRVDWIAMFSSGWAVLIAAIGVAFWMGGRMETPAEKQRRIDRAVAPLLAEVRKCESHRNTGGHDVMHSRVLSIERRMNSIDAVERDETEILRALTATAREQTTLMRSAVQLLDDYLHRRDE